MARKESLWKEDSRAHNLVLLIHLMVYIQKKFQFTQTVLLHAIFHRHADSLLPSSFPFVTRKTTESVKWTTLKVPNVKINKESFTVALDG